LSGCNRNVLRLFRFFSCRRADDHVRWPLPRSVSPAGVPRVTVRPLQQPGCAERLKRPLMASQWPPKRRGLSFTPGAGQALRQPCASGDICNGCALECGAGTERAGRFPAAQATGVAIPLPKTNLPFLLGIFRLRRAGKGAIPFCGRVGSPFSIIWKVVAGRFT
jgi:hypothetical protein